MYTGRQGWENNKSLTLAKSIAFNEYHSLAQTILDISRKGADYYWIRVTASDIATFTKPTVTYTFGYAVGEKPTLTTTDPSAVTNSCPPLPNATPTSSNSTVSTTEDTTKTITTNDIAFTDNDNGDTLAKLVITSISNPGTLFNDANSNGIVDTNETLANNDEISKADLDANQLKFLPATDGNGTGYSSFQFKVHDGTDPSAAAYTMTIDVTAVNDVPSFTKGANQTVSAGTNTAQTVNNWATALNKGATNESTQTLSFNVSPTGDSIFTTAPAIDANGNLTYTPNGTSGTATVSVTIKDDDGTANGGVDTSAAQTFTITVEEAITVTIPNSVSESGTTTTGTVSVPTNVSGNLTVNLSSDDTGEATVPASVTISSGQNSTTFTITGIDDAIIDGDQTPTITATGYTDGTADVTVQDDDIAGVTVGSIGSAIIEGANNTYTIKLNTNPDSGDVTIGVSSDGQCTVNPTSVSLSNSTAAAITVTATDDSNIEGDHSCTINHAITASDDTTNYPTTGMSIADVTASITDNEPYVKITQSSGTNVTEGGNTDTFDVVLSTQPQGQQQASRHWLDFFIQQAVAAGASVTVNLTADNQSTLDISSLVFDADTWDQPQTVTVTAVDDSDVEGSHSGTISLSASSDDPDYEKATFVVDGTAATNLSVNITDNDSPPPTDTGGPTSTPLPDEMTVFTKFGGLGSGTVTSSPSGINCKTADEECSAKFDTTTKVKLSVKADSGSEFDRWSGKDCDTEMFLVSSRTCTAYFKLTPRNLTVEYPENGVITSSPTGIDCGDTSQECSYEFEGGKNISLTATPNTDYMVDSWSQNCPDGKVQLLENTKCSATFKVKPAEPIVITPVDPTVPDVVPPTTGTDPVVPTIPDADEPAISTNTVSFSEQNYEVAENAGRTEITATRIGTEGKVTVELRSSEDDRHKPIAETLKWDDGTDGDITVPITIIDNDKVDGNKEVILSLGATENASLIDPDTSILTIVDDDKPDVPVAEIPADDIETPSTTSTYVPANNACSSGNVINTTCDFNWNNAKDVIIEKNGNVSHLTVKTDVKNDGIIGNSEITEGNQVTGGFLTGYITNHGILKDFSFVGYSINGANKAGEIVGILAGKITNTSKVEGFFENVRLASGTHIIGGILSGQIIGNSEQPALLESLIIKSKAVISNVILAEDVELEDGVVFGENIGFSIHINYMESHNLIGLPALGDAIFFKGNARSFARLTGGASENGGPFQRKSTITRKSQVTIKSNLLIDVKHIGKQADILVVALHEGKFYMLNSEGKPVIWDGNISSLIAFQKPENLAPVESIEIWNNPLDITGSVKVYVGYRLANGKIVYSPKDMIEMDLTE
ncbi:Calx-beta domain-containing protein [Candidatus Halobeggiatoa sp. HSG11]|nr:Calx-beta domain-containing protein [Candidatus Halobeggiatoa sp. HSG11]